MRVAALQMVSTPRVAENLAQARELIAQAALAGAELVALPEYFCLMGLHDKDKLRIAERVARYDKIHLFCFHDGQRRYDEAASLTPGVQPVSFEMRDKQGEPWHIGLSVCYDLRFAELFRMLGAQKPLDLIVLPAAFTDTTGKAHWELLLRARAVENLCHVLAPAQGGLHENGRRTFGHSLVIEPWGQVLAMQTHEGAGVVVAELNKAHQSQLRTQLPALSHRVLGQTGA
jgi:predicted amidohydrolase